MTDPLYPCPLMTMLPPARNRVPLPNAPDETLPSPHCGHVPEMAIGVVHTGPAARLLRLNAYALPFLLIAASRGFDAASFNSIGVEPKSESTVSAEAGSAQEDLIASVLASRATTASESICDGWLRVPVVTKIVLVEVSRLGVVHTPAPTCPCGTKVAVCTI